MSRFILSMSAGADLDEVRNYFRGLPKAPAQRIGRAIQNALVRLAQHPHQGYRHPEDSELAGEEIRSSVVRDYLIFHAATRTPLTYVGVIHGKRDVDSIMRSRLS